MKVKYNNSYNRRREMVTNIRKKVTSLIGFFRLENLGFMVFLGVALFMLCSSANASGHNYLEGLSSDVSATFGNDSDIPKYLYGAEAFVGAFTYITTRSPKVFIGLPIVMLMTHWGLQKAFG